MVSAWHNDLRSSIKGLRDTIGGDVFGESVAEDVLSTDLVHSDFASGDLVLEPEFTKLDVTDLA